MRIVITDTSVFVPVGGLIAGVLTLIGDLVNNPKLKHGDLCEAYTKRSLHKLNYFLQ